MVLAKLLPPKRSALLIDYDNAAGLFPKQQFVQRISNWLTWLKDGRFDPSGRKREFVDKRVYWHPVNGGQQPAFEHHGFICETCVYEADGKRGMSAVDINLAMDAIDIANRRAGLQEIIILASDSDYVSLIERLKKKRIQTSIVVSSRDVSIMSYTGRADLVIPDEKLAEAADYVRGRHATAPAPKPASPKSPAAAKAGRPKTAPAKAKSKSQAATVSPSLAPPDLSMLAKIVEDLAQDQSGPVGQDKVMVRLTGKRAFPKDGLAGKRTYREFAEAIVKLRPRLGMIVYRSGQSVSIYRKRKSPGDQARTA